MYNKAAPDAQGMVAYAHAWIYSAEGKPVFVNVMLSGAAKIRLNGKDLGAFGANGSRLKLALEKGWNGLLLRVAPLTDTAWSKGVVQWHFNAAFFGTERDDYESRNILWSTPMPDNGPGVGSPILVGEKLLVQAEAATLICLSAKDGKVLWARSSTYADAATQEERKKNPDVFAEADPLAAKVQESLQAYGEAPDKYVADTKARGERMECERKINKLLKKADPERYAGQSSGEAGESAPTPVSDGQNVYALYGSGVVACFDLAGNRKWTTVIGVKHSEHGYCPSPCLIDGKLVVKASSYLGAVALDGKTGAVVTPIRLWKTEGLNTMSTPLPLAAGGEKLIVQSFGVITRAGDGKILAQRFTPPYYNIADYISPTVEGATICSHVLAKTDGAIRFAFQTLPDSISDPLVMKDTKECEYQVKAFPCWFSYNHNASPLLYQGLAYVMSVDGVLTVIDAAKGEVVYQKLLDFSPLMYHNGPIVRAGCSGSPTLAGKYIYLWDDQGTAVVLSPGRTFKQVARNRIEQLWFRYGPERNECTISNPIFCGNRLFHRGEVNLYCIGQKDK
jgi:outer membrane protein assembly factor BamB